MNDNIQALANELTLTPEQSTALQQDLTTAPKNDLKQIQDEEQKRKKQRAQEQQANRQQMDQALQQKQEANGVAKVGREFGTAVVGAGIDAVEGIGATAQRVLTGKVNDENFTPSWLQVDDRVEPMNQTWWGNLIRGVGEYALLSVATRKVGGKLPGGAGRLLAGKGISNEVARGAVIGNLSSHAEDDKNLSNYLHEALPFIPTPLAIQESDSPMMKRVKSTFEGAGFDFVFEKVGAFLNAKKAAKQAVDGETNNALRRQALDRLTTSVKVQDDLTTSVKVQDDLANAKANYNNLKNQWIADNGGAVVSSANINAKVKRLTKKAAANQTTVDADTLTNLKEQLRRASEVEAARKELSRLRAEAAVTSKSRTVDDVAQQAYDDSLKQSGKRRERVEADNAVHFYKKDPKFANGPNPRTVHPDLLDTQEKAKFVPDTDLKTSLRNAIEIDTNPRQADGRIGSVMTDANYDKVTAGSDGVRKVISEMMTKMAKDPELETFIGGQRYSKQEVINMVASKALDTLEGLDGLTADELKAVLLDRADTNWVGGAEWKTMNSVNQAATQILIRATAGELASLADVERSIRGSVDTTTQKEMFINRLETLLRLNKEASYIAGKKLADRHTNWVRRFLPEARNDIEASRLIDDQVKGVVGTVRQIADSGDNRLLNLFMDAASVSNADVRTMTDLAAFVKKKIGVNGWLYGNPSEQGYLLRAATSSFFNSILSSPKTVMRAWFGTGTMAALRPLNLLAGGVMRGDRRIVAKSLHQMQSGFEAIGEAIKMADISRKSWIAGEPNPAIMRGVDEQYLPFHKTEEFQSYMAWADLKGGVGDKAAVKLAYHLSAFNSHWMVNYGMGLMEMGDTFTRTILGRMELKSRAFDEAWVESGAKVSQDLISSYEKKFRDSIFDQDGVVTDKAARLAAEEVTLTTPLSGFAEDFDNFIKSVPLVRPFFMFPRTAHNALKYVASYTPILNKSLKEIDEVMNCTLEDAPAIMQKYGITDLEAARAQYEGRVAVGTLTTLSAIGLYLNGKLTGNQTVGAENKRLRESLKDMPPPRSVLVGNQWISYEAFEPMSSLLSLVADIGEKVDPEDQEHAFSKVSFFIAANLTNKSFVAGIGQLSDLVTGRSEALGPTYVANQMNNAIPYGGARNWLAQVFTPGKRELENDIMQRFMNRNPGLRSALPLQRDWITGEAIRVADPLIRLINATLPVNINAKADRTKEIILKSGYDAALDFRKGPNNEDLTPKEREGMILYATEGGRIKKSLDELVNKKFFVESFDAYQDYLKKGGLVEDFAAKNTAHVRAIAEVVREAKQYGLARYRMEQSSSSQLTRPQASQLAKEAAKRGDSGTQKYYLDQLINMK